MSKVATGTRRSSLEITKEVLLICGNGGARKTAVMYRTNLSYKQLVWYLTRLRQKHLLTENSAGLFQITNEGHQVLEQIAGVSEILESLRERETGCRDECGPRLQPAASLG